MRRGRRAEGVEEQGWRRRPLQPPGQKLGVEPRTCAWCSDSTSAPPEAAGAWLLQASEPTTLAEVYMQISCTRAPNFVYTAGVVHAAERTRTPAQIRAWCLSSALRYYYYHFSESKKETGECGEHTCGTPQSPTRTRAHAPARGALTLEFSEKACREPGPSLLNKLPLPN